MNGVQVAKALRWSTSKISRLETGQVAPTVKDVEKLLKQYDVEAELSEILISLAAEGGAKGWWESYSDVLNETVIELIGLEAGATRVRAWHATVLPGLLQTRDYATQVGLLYRSLELVSPSKIDRRTRVRLRRQRLLESETPLRLSVVLDEAVLRRRFGDSDDRMMREQLCHLVEVSKLPNVSIRVLRLDQPHPTDITNFLLLSFPSMPVLGPISNDVVYYENVPLFNLVEDDETVYQYSLVFDLLVKAALDEDASKDFMTALADV